jgi:hypothetical protein
LRRLNRSTIISPRPFQSGLPAVCNPRHGRSPFNSEHYTPVGRSHALDLGQTRRYANSKVKPRMPSAA